ncbi:MAG: EAL domain-containing protein [Rhodocyclales bacterium]|nr:EAL domain-containing protein [Rhodocyclales bacterium]
MVNAAKPRRKHWWQGILARSLFAVIGMALLLGGASGLIVSQTIGEREHQKAVRALNELLDTVESTASIASFANDEQLAAEVARGLLRNSDVLRVVIRSGERELAHVERIRAAAAPAANPGKVGAGESAALPASLSNALLRPLISPFKKNEVIGEIVLDADWPAIDARVSENAKDTVKLLMGQMALIVAVVAALMIHLVIRPIKKTSDQMHDFGPSSGMLLGIPEGHENTEIGSLVMGFNDLTGRLMSTLEQERALQKQQAVAQRKYQILFEQAASGIFIADRDGCLESFNHAFVELTWLPAQPDKAVYLTDPGWRTPESLLSLLRRCLDDSAHGGLVEDDFILDGQRGDERWLHVAVIPLGDGSVQGSVTDVTLRKKEELNARHLAHTDSLTGFANRTGLQQALSVIAQDSPPFALVMVDLDGFKQINEAMGFAVGDQLLLMLAARIREFAHEKDSIFRIGGDEFALVLASEHTRGTTRERLDRLLVMLASPYEFSVQDKMQKIALGASVGVAFYPADGQDLHQLLRNAELALNDARVAGGHVYRYFEPAMLTAVEHRQRLEDDLRHALRAGDLYLAFQPIVDLATLKTTGAETLLRWSHPVRGMVSPDIFIPLAEEVGLIGEIGLMVLEGACRQLAVWRQAGLDLYVSVNVSVRQIPDDLPPAVVIGLLKQYGLPPGAIALEITEGVLMRDVAVAQTWIASLGVAGLSIYLDDFGTGYSSLSYLKRFPMGTVKIDKSFIRDMERDSSDRSLVIAIVEMCRSLGLKVVAEGVENEAQFVILRELGCNYGQGYLFSPAVRGDDFAQAAARIDAELTAGRVNAIGLAKTD